MECGIKAGTEGGSKVGLKGKVKISVPRRLTPRAKEALEEYRAVS